MIDKIKDQLEKSAFGVCSYLGEKIGIASSRVRLYFIYASFVAFGSPVVVYLALAFWVNIRKYLKAARNIIWH